MEGQLTIEPVVKRKLCTGCGTCAGDLPAGRHRDGGARGKGLLSPPPRQETMHAVRTMPPGLSGTRRRFRIVQRRAVRGRSRRTSRWVGTWAAISATPSTGTSGVDCASGGLVSSLLIFALEEGLIDGALVTRMREDNPLRPEPFIARNERRNPLGGRLEVLPGRRRHGPERDPSHGGPVRGRGASLPHPGDSQSRAAHAPRCESEFDIESPFRAA